MVRTRRCSLFPVYHGSAKDNLGTEKLIEVITETFVTETKNNQSELCGYVFKVEYDFITIPAKRSNCRLNGNSPPLL